MGYICDLGPVRFFSATRVPLRVAAPRHWSPRSSRSRRGAPKPYRFLEHPYVRWNAGTAVRYAVAATGQGAERIDQRNTCCSPPAVRLRDPGKLPRQDPASLSRRRRTEGSRLRLRRARSMTQLGRASIPDQQRSHRESRGPRNPAVPPSLVSPGALPSAVVIGMETNGGLGSDRLWRLHTTMICHRATFTSAGQAPIRAPTPRSARRIPRFPNEGTDTSRWGPSPRHRPSLRPPVRRST